MLLFSQVVVAVLTISVMTGPIGHYASLRGVGPDLAILFCWAYTWFGSRDLGWKFAAMVGVVLDLILFMFPGLQTLTLMILVAVADYLKNRFLNVSSVVQSILILALMTLANASVIGLVNGQFDYMVILLTGLFNVCLGIIIYPLVGIRFRFFQRWAGHRL